VTGISGGYQTPDFGLILKNHNYHDFNRRLGNLKRLDPSKYTSEQIDSRFRMALQGYITRTIIIGSNGVWRARSNEFGNVFEDAADLWFPPAAEVVRRGRFNEARKSVFYCSDKISSAVEEMRPIAGDRITVLFAGAKSPGASISLGHIGVHLAVTETDIVGNMGGGLRSDDDWIKHLDQIGIRRRWLALDNYLTDIAARDYSPAEQQDCYKITNALARMLMQPSGIQGIIYPSVAADMTAFNMSFPPQIADKHFFPFEAWEVEVVTPPIDGTSSVASFIRQGSVSDSGKINWGPRLHHVDQANVRDTVARSIAARRAG
jgi:hypothetical protein